MFDLKEIIIGRLSDVVRDSPYNACRLVKSIVLSTLLQGGLIVLGIPSIRNIWNYAVEFKEIYQVKIYGLYLNVYYIFILFLNMVLLIIYFI